MNTTVSTARAIRELASVVVRRLHAFDSASEVARRRVACPIDYMRYAEFESILSDLDIAPKMKILDVSSPQWFTLFLASQNPETTFYYMNIIDSEIKPFRKIADVLQLHNIVFLKGDVRHLAFPVDTFDRIISISVIEHVFPAESGDATALKEIEAVMKSSGRFLMTIPYKAKANIVYLDTPVYERADAKRSFFAREYDQITFNALIEQSGFSAAGIKYLCERSGIFAKDYYEWGPGKSLRYAGYFVLVRRKIEQFLLKHGMSLDRLLARRYLVVSSKVVHRVVNVSAVLVKKPKNQKQ